MNRFLRTAYSAIYAYLWLTLLVVTVTRTDMPFPAFLCLFFGLLTALVPDIFDTGQGIKALWAVLGGLLALLGFLPILISGGSLFHYILYGFAGLAVVSFFFLRRQSTTHRRFMDSFRLTIIIFAISLFIILFLWMPFLTAMTHKRVPDLSWENIMTVLNNLIPVFIMLLAVGVLHLRGLRSENIGIDQKLFRQRQLRDLMIFMTCVTIVYAFNPLRYIVRGLLFLFRNGLIPFLKKILSLFAFEWNTDHHRNDEPQPEATYEYEETMPESTEYQEIPLEPPQGDGLLKSLLFLLILVAVIALVFLIIQLLKKKARAQKTYRGYPVETMEALEEEETPQRDPSPKKRSRDPRMKIRYQYLMFLNYVKRIPVSLKKTQTSGEIADFAAETIPEKAGSVNALTEIYDRARYQHNIAPSPADAEEMKKLLEKVLH